MKKTFNKKVQELNDGNYKVLLKIIYKDLNGASFSPMLYSPPCYQCSGDKTESESERTLKPGDGEECCEMLSSAHAIATTTMKQQ